MMGCSDESTVSMVLSLLVITKRQCSDCWFEDGEPLLLPAGKPFPGPSAQAKASRTSPMPIVLTR
jgi:hypothetical protein